MPKTVITESSKKKIIDIIEGWKGKLSWKALCERVTKELGLRTQISRHTLLAYEDLKIAYEERKNWLKNNPTASNKRDDMQLQAAYDRIDKLETKVKRLQAERTVLQEQFVRWQYNLYYMGYNMDDLNMKLPSNVDVEEVKQALDRKPLRSILDSSKLNQALEPLTRANDNRRRRIKPD